MEQYNHFITINTEQHSTFKVITAVIVKADVFRGVTSCSLVDIDRLFVPHKAVIFSANTVFFLLVAYRPINTLLSVFASVFDVC